MKKPKSENRFQHKGIKYKAVELGVGEICGDCEFYSPNLTAFDFCSFKKIKKAISCIASERKDNRNIRWSKVNEN
jgi:hypothetical protein